MCLSARREMPQAGAIRIKAPPHCTLRQRELDRPQHQLLQQQLLQQQQELQQQQPHNTTRTSSERKAPRPFR